MMSQQQFAALLGFAFAAIWIASSLGDALLCLLGAAVFWAANAYMRGELDLDALNERLQGPNRGDRL